MRPPQLLWTLLRPNVFPMLLVILAQGSSCAYLSTGMGLLPQAHICPELLNCGSLGYSVNGHYPDNTQSHRHGHYRKTTFALYLSSIILALSARRKRSENV